MEYGREKLYCVGGVIGGIGTSAQLPEHDASTAATKNAGRGAAAKELAEERRENHELSAERGGEGVESGVMSGQWRGFFVSCPGFAKSLQFRQSSPASN